MKRYQNLDPRWITAKFAGKCPSCNAAIGKGSRAYYYPNGKSVYCQPCGDDAQREFDAACFDEASYNSY
jgi:hypothetical protein